MVKVACPCTEIVAVSRVKVEENGKQAVFLNTLKVKYHKVQIDGCLIVGSVACDWLVSSTDIGTVLVELKGKDVDHALEQLEASISYVKKQGTYGGKFAALVVCSGVPKHPSFNTKLQRIKNRFATKFKAPIHIVAGNHEFELANVMSFKGPHKT